LLQTRPDVVIGIDAPDFNLAVERRLKEAGLRTMH
jgi:lipid-A-disaccharide synthase